MELEDKFKLGFCTKCGSEKILAAESLAVRFGDRSEVLQLGNVKLPKCSNMACDMLYVSPDSPQGRRLHVLLSTLKAHLGIPEETDAQVMRNSQMEA
ncbi:MAG: hypothetical protein A3B96_01115 [Candidatus Spechtbacteria bacterium RIFCSPHIGHO2_02_FULL_43_15b]|uniref:Uncharacterized protein n=1 Tax=Candidatus Spechtbacteria bacterium RIFCSPHIGHO2_01_FULL_43_30 TaxID=1802158 RepID=A0A1G2H4D6_9BACT|nr:MAG: hypothetical protein A2827_03515 [Candidatus Spechtbacteria bacterium RIFCSPHIGHO2_01_FULL_43_30]OGZ59014.1 MAG: hypothetical protein A3B96_01115 [Candidatus Spechtbacteria bacterium RIFCSPHIGHO2_02_FULL_43_15b]